MKRVRYIFMSLLLMTSLFFGTQEIKAKADDSLALGADIGWLNQLENQGVTWLNDEGNTEDALQILKDHGIDSVRLRVFVNPPSSFQWTKNNGTTCLLGYADTTGLLYMAQRADALGMKIMVDFHYSDHFADPEYQDIPSAWSGASYSQLVSYVYDYTHYVMSALANVGIYPEWVQVGNEINSGMLLPYGDSGSNFSQLAGFLNSGYDAVKAVSSSSKVVTHLANGHNNEVFDWFFNTFLNTYHGKTDVIGMSYYPYWIGSDYKESIGALSANLNDMAATYGKEVMVCEVGGYEDNPSNTYDLLRATINAVKAVPNNKGTGVFYWEPEANSSVLPDSYPLGATRKVSGKVLQFTTAIDAFGGVTLPDSTDSYYIVNRNSEKALNVRGGSASDSAVIEQYSNGGWDSQKWKFISAGSGYYRIENVRSGKVLDISGKSTADGAACIQYTYNGGYNQMWQLVESSDGYFKIKNRNSGKILDINAMSVADGAECIQYTDNGGWNQMWSFVPAD